MTKETKPLDEYFQIYDEPFTRSLYINHLLLHMTTAQLRQTCQTYGLEPMEQYLDMRTLQTKDGEENIKGFIRYLDIYLIEKSAGKESDLRILGETLLGVPLTGKTARLLRLEIIQGMLLKYQRV